MIVLEEISKVYKNSNSPIYALDNVSLHINSGELVSIVGKSGSGKTTLLNMIGLMDSPSSGSYTLNKNLVDYNNKKQIENLRRTYISYVFQQFALMNYYSVYDNIEVPLVAKKISHRERKEIIYSISERLGIDDLLKKTPKQLSGGQQQRVAIARAIASENPIILADEPTGALDSRTSQNIVELLLDMNKLGRTVILVTHDEGIADIAQRKITIRDGKII